MAAVSAFVVAINKETVSAGQYRVLLDVLVEGQPSPDPYRTDAVVNLSATPSGVNNTLIGAAVDKAQAEGFTVGVLDQKTLLACAVGVI